MGSTLPRSAPILLAFAVGCSGADETTTPDAGRAPDAGEARDAGPACEAWEISYALTGAFEVRGVIGGPRTNAIGPGTLVLRFAGIDAPREAGAVEVLSYENRIMFEDTGIETDLTATAGPEPCGLAVGEAASSTVTWSEPLTDHRVAGTIVCNGQPLVCAFAQLPEGEVVDRDDTYDLPLAPFAFDAEGDFDMSWVEVPTPDDPGDSFLRFSGTETSSACVPLPTGC